MDRRTIYRNQVPLQEDILQLQRNALEGLGLFARDLLGDSPAVAGFACTATSPASMAVNVAPGRIYQLSSLEAADWGVLAGTGGLPADVVADHKIVKQGLLRDAATFAMTAPTTAGQSINYLIQGTFIEADDTASTQQFYNSANPTAPISSPVSVNRMDIASLNVKAGAAATTGSQVTPAVDAGYVPLWVVTVPYGATTLTSSNIAAHPSKPTISVGGGGGGGSALAPWTVITSATTLAVGGRYIVDNTAALTCTLPAAPAGGDEIWIKGNFITNNLTLARNGKTIELSATDLVLNDKYMTVHLVYDTNLVTWRV